MIKSCVDANRSSLSLKFITCVSHTGRYPDVFQLKKSNTFFCPHQIDMYLLQLFWKKNILKS